MNSQDIQKLITGGESERLEFKSGDVAPSAIAKVLCAFLNARGGLILIGVTDKGKVAGVRDAQALGSLFKKQLPKLISPSALWDVEQVQVEGVRCTGDQCPRGTRSAVRSGRCHLLKARGQERPCYAR